jgi:uncharacterized protein (TIGR02001 family)
VTFRAPHWCNAAKLRNILVLSVASATKIRSTSIAYGKKPAGTLRAKSSSTTPKQGINNMNSRLKRSVLSTSIVAALSTVGMLSAAHAQQASAPSPHTFATKVSLFSEYEYRGISQTSEKPALQLNLDYSHSSGFYAGAFVSNIKWIKDSTNDRVNGNVEIDLFGGYKWEINKELTFDFGYLRYEYPNTGGLNPKPNTDELYIGAISGPFSAKYSRTVSDAFGFTDSKGSTFTELNWAQEIVPKFTMNAQIARASFKNNNDATYTVYKVGGTYDLGNGFNVGGYYKDTNAKKDFYTVKGRDWSKGRLVAFVSKTF